MPRAPVARSGRRALRRQEHGQHRLVHGHAGRALGDRAGDVDRVRDERRDVDRRPAHPRSGPLPRPRSCARTGRATRRDHVHRVLQARRRGEEGAQALHRGRRQLGQRQAARFAGVGEEDARAARVGDDAHARAARHGLRGQQRHHVEEVLQRLRPDDPGLLEQGLDRDVQAPPAPRSGSRPRACRRPSGRTSPRPPASGGRPRAPSARTAAGCRSSRGTARSRRCAGPPSNTRAGRCRRRPPCCPPTRRWTGRCPALARSRGWPAPGRRSARAWPRCRPAGTWAQTWR